MRAWGLVVLVSLSGCGGPVGAIDGAVPDAGAAPDAPSDADRFADARPYETVLPSCADPALWDLAPNSGWLAGATGGCLTSYSQPLVPFVISATSFRGAPPLERVCYRVTESIDSGWEIGAVIETDGHASWEGYVAGARPFVAFEMRAMYEGGWLAAVPRVTFESLAGLEVARDVDPITALTRHGGYATVSGIVGSRSSSAVVADLRALTTIGGRTAWIEETASGARVGVFGAQVGDPIAHVPIAGDATRVLATEWGPWSLVAMGEVVWTVQAWSDDAGTITVWPEPTATLDAPPDQLLADDALAAARVGDRVVVVSEPAPIDDPLLASGVDALVPGPSLHVLRDGSLVPIELVPGDPSTLRARADRAIALDPRIGSPLLVLGDGRVLGTLGIAGPPRPPSPDFVAIEDAFGGTLEAAGLAPPSAALGGIHPWGYLAIARPGEHVVVEVGFVHPDACGL